MSVDACPILLKPSGKNTKALACDDTMRAGIHKQCVADGDWWIDFRSFGGCMLVSRLKSNRRPAGDPYDVTRERKSATKYCLHVKLLHARIHKKRGNIKLPGACVPTWTPLDCWLLVYSKREKRKEDVRKMEKSRKNVADNKTNRQTGESQENIARYRSTAFLSIIIAAPPPRAASISCG